MLLLLVLLLFLLVLVQMVVELAMGLVQPLNTQSLLPPVLLDHHSPSVVIT